MTAKLRQHSLSVRKLQELMHDCNVQLATFRNFVQQIGTLSDTAQLRRELDVNAQLCVRLCEAAKNCVLMQLKQEGVEFTRHASQFIGCVSACVIEMKRYEALEKKYKINGSETAGNNSPRGTNNPTTSSTFESFQCTASSYIPTIEEMLESLENLITVHYSTSESAPDAKVTPRRRRNTTCRPQCICSKVKTSYA